MDGFHHEAVFYADEDEYCAALVPFLKEGVEAREAILVAVSEPKIRLLQRELNGHAEQVGFVDMQRLGVNPARIIPAWRDFVDRNTAEGRSVRGIGEPIWPGRSSAELAECHHHESLLNLAFAGPPDWRLLCPYDTSALDDEVLEGAKENHPVLRAAGVEGKSRTYAKAEVVGSPFTGELPEPAIKPREIGFVGGELRVVRGFIADCATQAGMPEERKLDFILAANEVATNSVRHGGGHGTMRIWREDGTMIGEVRDHGRIAEPLVGRVRPAAEQIGDRGLWAANQLCDLVQIRSDQAGTAVRLHMPLAPR